MLYCETMRIACDRREARPGRFWIVALALATSMHSLSASSQQFQPSQILSMPGDNLRIYGVKVVKTRPFGKEFTGYGVYLAGGKVLTAAHVVGNWPEITHPRVQVMGLDLPATVEKVGSVEGTDLALLSIDQSQLPASLQLRRNPLCDVAVPPGTTTVVVYPERTVLTHTLSPLFIAAKYRIKFASLINEPQSSGSGVFLPDHHCLLGIISMKIQKFVYRRQPGKLFTSPAGWAGYYVPATVIRPFLARKIPQ